MRILSVLAALVVALPLPLAAQEQSQIDKVIGARLIVSEFMRICVLTDADPDQIESMALDETWIPDAPSSILGGLNRVPPADATVYTFTRSRSTSVGRRRTDVQVIVPAPGVRDCTVEFEDTEFAGVKSALSTSGFSEEMEEGSYIPAEAPARIRRAYMCRPEVSYREPECIQLSMDPAAFPLTGQMTLDRVGGEEQVLD
ncbi:MAG: hypothetical protein AAGA69_04630 [Pseudomonadota bacterium]